MISMMSGSKAKLHGTVRSRADYVDKILRGAKRHHLLRSMSLLLAPEPTSRDVRYSVAMRGKADTRRTSRDD